MRNFARCLTTAVVLITAGLWARSGWSQCPPENVVLEWGSAGDGLGQFYNPQDLTVDENGYVYVSDTGHGRVQKFSPNGGFIASWGSGGPGNEQFNAPNFVASDHQGHIYVCDTGNDRIQKLTTDGAFLSRWGTTGSGPREFNGPSGVAVDVNGNVYVPDGNNRVQKFDQDGNFILQWGSSGSGNGQFSETRGIVVGSDGNVYVGDFYSHRLQKFTPSGEFLDSWTGSVSLYNLEASPQGYIYAPTSDQFTHQVYIFNNDLDLVCSFTSGFTAATGVGIDETGAAVYTLEWYDPPTSRLVVSKRAASTTLRPVVLVHGYCSDETMWNDLASYLVGKGFSVSAPRLVPNNGRPSVLTRQLADHLDQYYPNQAVDIIAHSMGGLVTRSYVRQRALSGEDGRIRTLVTLATPHHGIDIANLAVVAGPLRKILQKVDPCLVEKKATLVDLSTGSSLLNKINYGHESPGDQPLAHSIGTHDTEISYGPNPTIWTFAGTQGFKGGAKDASMLAWCTTPLAIALRNPNYRNDGVVGVDAARMYNNLNHNYVDTELGLAPIQHFPPFLLYHGARSFQNANDLFPQIENILRGGTPYSSPPPSPNETFETESASDTVVTTLVSKEGILTAGQSFEQAFALPNTPFVQVVLVADSVLYRLRKPDGTLLSPADTLTTVGLHYTEDLDLGIATYTVENPNPGNWKAVFNANGTALNHEYALSVDVMSAMVVAISPASMLVHAPGSTQVRASLKSAGVPQLSVTWNVMVTKPDSTTFLLNLYDDGAHQDSLTSDGIYGGTLNVTGPVGLYQVSAIATPASDSVTYIGSTVVELANLHDLAVQGTLLFSGNSASPGDSLTVLATIRNFGVDPVDSLIVEFLDNQVKYATVTLLNVVPNDSRVVSAVWHATVPDTHLVRVVIDPFKQTDETDYANNSASRTVVLGQPIAGVESPVSRHTQLGPVVPNPSSRQMTIHFVTTMAGPVTLSLYDVAGRRIKRWIWQNLPGGPQSVEWNGICDNGMRATAGVLFIRLWTNGHTQSGKTVRLQ